MRPRVFDPWSAPDPEPDGWLPLGWFARAFAACCLVAAVLVVACWWWGLL